MMGINNGKLAPSIRPPKTTTFEGLIPSLERRKLNAPRHFQYSRRNMISNPASYTLQERFTELFELACKEPDQDKVGTLFEEILCLLDRQTTQPDRATCDGKPHTTAVSASI